MPEFMTIREVAQRGLISETLLRRMVKNQACPGVYSGNRFLVNVTALAEQLDAQSRANVKAVVDR